MIRYHIVKFHSVLKLGVINRVWLPMCCGAWNAPCLAKIIIRIAIRVHDSFFARKLS